MKTLALLLLLSTLSYAQAGAEPPPRENLPPAPKAPVNLNDSESAHKARALLDQTIEALGGQPFLTYKSRSEAGRYYPLHHGTTESLGIPYNYYLEYPDKDRFEVIKMRDIFLLKIRPGQHQRHHRRRGKSAQSQKELTDRELIDR